VDARQRGEAAARQKAAAFRAAQQARARRRRFVLWGAIAAAVVVIVGVRIGAGLASGSGSGTPAAERTTGSPATAPAGPEGIPLEQGTLLAAASTSATGQPVDGVSCEASEQVVYHIHTHLAVYVDGRLRPLPAGVGIVEPVPQQSAHGAFDQASRCYYWLHVHAQDGIIHVESPTRATYTLGQFFAIWRQPLSRSQVGPARGAVTAYVDGKTFTGDPATIPLEEHEVVQLDVGTPAVAPQPVDWSHAQL
jgi:hypothetical protein